MAQNLYSYVVRHDSGFAPNPFFDYCTLATCKPKIRERAVLGDWVIGTGSNNKEVRRGGHLVYAMRVTEILDTTQYWYDDRFRNKRPNLYLNWKTASGDNIYEPLGESKFKQLDSYHSMRDGSPNLEHLTRDTKIERVLISDDFVYYGGEGPKLPAEFLSGGTHEILHKGQFHRRFDNEKVIHSFVTWLRSREDEGYTGKPWDWVRRRQPKKR